MKASSYYSEKDKLHIVELLVSDNDMNATLNSREIIRDVRTLIAEEIVKRIMDKLGPVLDKALGEYKP